MLGIAAVAGMWADRHWSARLRAQHWKSRSSKGLMHRPSVLGCCAFATSLQSPCCTSDSPPSDWALFEAGTLLACACISIPMECLNCTLNSSSCVCWWAEALAAMESWLWSENSSLASAEPGESGPVLESHRQRYQSFLSCFLCSLPRSGTAYSTNSLPSISYRFSMLFHRCSSLPVQLLAQCPSLHQNEQHGTWAEVMQRGVALQRKGSEERSWVEIYNLKKNIFLARFAYICISVFWRVCNYMICDMIYDMHVYNVQE